MNVTKTLLINNIALTFTKEDLPLLPPFEVKQYIGSAEFFEDVLTLHKTGVIIIGYRSWSCLYRFSNIKAITGYRSSEDLEYGVKGAG